MAKKKDDHWRIQFTVNREDALDLHGHIDFMNRWFHGLIWCDGTWNKHSNLVIDRTGTAYTVVKATARSQGLDKPYPRDEELLIFTSILKTVIVRAKDFFSYGGRLVNGGRYGEGFWNSYDEYLEEFALASFSAEDWNDACIRNYITFIYHEKMDKTEV